MLALLDYQSQKCPGCRGFLPETTDAENEGRYDADLPHRCWRCDAVAARQDGYKDAPHPTALTVWPVKLRR